MVYSIVLVDDEVQVRSSIRSTTAWADYGFRIVGEAGNGIEALELIEEKQPDVVITDIRMPYMDGIELIRSIREVLPAAVIIILSGYDEFTYAQTAIRYNVKEYLLKPVSHEDICSLLQRIHGQIDHEFEHNHDQDLLQKAYKQALPQLKEKYLVSLLSPVKEVPERILVERGETYGYQVSDKDCFHVAVIEAERMDNPLMLQAMLHVCREVLGKDGSLLLQMDDQIVLMFNGSCCGEEGVFLPLFTKRCMQHCKEVSAYLNRYIPGGVTIGLSPLCRTLSALGSAYRKALVALNYKAYEKDQHVLYFNDMEQTYHPKLDLLASERLKDEFLKLLKLGSEEEVVLAVARFFDDKSGLDPEGLQSYVLSLLSSLAELTLDYGTSLSKVSSNRNFFAELSSVTTVGRAKHWFTMLSLDVHRTIKGEREKSHVRFVEDAKRYLLDNYSDPAVGLDKICDWLGVSTSYFSSTFKKETGVPFVQALNEVRLSQAQKLLVDTDLKNYEIAEKVGFSDPNYFSFCFKRNRGLSPTQYRARYRGSEHVLET
ncbi:MAG: response regulator [Spirochaetia bacterium]|jgi:two-component system response regulator YesN|nr:response regulator [Spirochaetia bacterium]